MKKNKEIKIEDINLILCVKCSSVYHDVWHKFKTYKDYIKHINKFHPPQAPKEWICKHKSLKYECIKCK